MGVHSQFHQDVSDGNCNIGRYYRLSRCRYCLGFMSATGHLPTPGGSS
jgi:hypothetical protein